jgi:hypothetical protein
MRGLIIIAMAASAAIATPAAAETWRGVGWAGQAPARFAYFVDVDSIRRNGGTIRFWEQEILEAPEPGGENRVLNYREGNCDEISTVILQSVYMDGDVVLTTSNERGNPVFHPPGSLMAGAMNAACGTEAYDTGPVTSPDATARRFYREGRWVIE